MYAWLCRTAGESSYLCQAFGPAHFAEWIQVAIALGALVGIIVGWVLTRRTLAEMRRQTRTLQRQLAFTDRAWLKVTVSQLGPFTTRPENDEHYFIDVTVDFENVGRSVATHVDAWGELFVVEPHLKMTDRINEVFSRFAAEERASASTARHPSWLRSVFPSDRSVAEWNVALSREEIGRGQYIAKKHGDQVAFQFFILGYAVYRLSNSNRRRVSTFGYFVNRQYFDGATVHKYAPFPVNALTNVPASEFSLVPVSGAFRTD
jgi:hypothetical protein